MIENQPDPREERLPKWARDTLRDLRAENRRLKRNLEGTDPETSRVVLDPYGEARGLGGEYTRVRFDDVSALLRGGVVGGLGLEISADGPLEVFPVATNMIRVRSGQR